jgi:hypothetical protein
MVSENLKFRLSDKQFLDQWLIRLAVTCICALPLVPSHPVIAQEIPSVCERDGGRMISHCAETCFDACNDGEFYFEMSEQCELILGQPSDQLSDAEGCAAGDAAKPKESSLDQCLSEVSSMESVAERVARKVDAFELRKQGKPQDVKDRFSELQESIKRLNAGFPSCVRSPEALIAIYKCLSSGVQTLKTGFEGIEKKGYRSKEIALCGISGLEDDFEQLIYMRRDARKLDKKFEEIAICRGEVEEWNNGRAESCSGDRCGELIQFDIERTNEAIAPAQRLGVDLFKVLGELEDNFKEVSSIIQIAVGSCPSTR